NTGAHKIARADLPVVGAVHRVADGGHGLPVFRFQVTRRREEGVDAIGFDAVFNRAHAEVRPDVRIARQQRRVRYAGGADVGPEVSVTRAETVKVLSLLLVAV